MKMTDILKKYVLPNLPYLIFLWFFAKVGEAVRLAPGVDASTKLLGLADGFTLAFQTSMPGAAVDWLVGLIGAALVRLVVYVKGKNAKKYRKDVEYGSARWGTKADIAPFMDPKPENNIILTQTEGLMMSGRPKNPAFARNKNVLVVGGSGSGGLTGNALNARMGVAFAASTNTGCRSRVSARKKPGRVSRPNQSGRLARKKEATRNA